MPITATRQRLAPRVDNTSARWWTRAACRGADLNLFFKPDKTETVSPAEQQRRESEAKSLCLRCPVTGECLAEAIAVGDRHAVRAGYTGTERRRLGLQ